MYSKKSDFFNMKYCENNEVNLEELKKIYKLSYSLNNVKDINNIKFLFLSHLNEIDGTMIDDTYVMSELGLSMIHYNQKSEIWEDIKRVKNF